MSPFDTTTRDLEHSRSTKNLNIAYRTILLVLIIAVFMCALASVREVYRTSDKLSRQNRGITNYLDCVGHLPIVGRSQEKVDACLDIMKKTSGNE